MDNSPHFRVCTFTLACVLLISSSGLHLLYADNDRCFRKAKCPNTAKPRTGKAGHARTRVSTPRPGVSNQVAVVPKRRGGRNSSQPRSNTSVATGNQLPATDSGLQSDRPDRSAESLPLPENSLNSNGWAASLKTRGISPVTTDFPLNNSVGATLQRGYELFNARKHSQAKKQFEAVLKDSPRNVQAHEGIGDVHMVKGRHSEAIKAYQRAWDLDPQNTALYDKLQQAIVIEREQDKVNQDKWWGILVQSIVIGVAAATAPRNSNQVKLNPQFRNRPMYQPKSGTALKPQ